MPTGNLPSSGKKLFEEVYNKALKGSCKGDKGCAAGSAWKAVKNAGWHKGADGQWTKKAELTEFSFVVTKASYDKATNERRWVAVASDTEEDSRKDSMTMELFQDFLEHIEKDDTVPEQFQSEYWKGGMPYISVSHYKDFNGKGVPGSVDALYVDGNRLKAKGRYFDTPLGRACFEALCDDLYNKQSKARDDKVRISIAFLDWKHKHKNDGFIFERNSLEDICVPCMLERIIGESQGKEFLRGQLVHLAHTRVPANIRTSMEVEQSMTTKKEDAASIIGEELAEMLDSEDQTVVGKSEALVIRAEGEEEVIVEEATPPNKHAEDTEYPDCMDEKTGEPDQDCIKRHKQMEKKSEVVEESVTDVEVSKDYAEVPMPMVYKPFGGATSLSDAKAYIEAGKEKMRISDLWYALQSVVENISTDETLEDKAKALKKAVDEFKGMMADKSATIYNSLFSLMEKPIMTEPEKVIAHPLDEMILKLKASYDDAVSAEGTAEDKLRALQPSYEQLGVFIQDSIKDVKHEPTADETDMAKFQKILEPLTQQMSMIVAQVQQLSQRPQAEVQQAMIIPKQRSIQTLDRIIPQLSNAGSSNRSVDGKTPNLRKLIEQTTY